MSLAPASILDTAGEQLGSFLPRLGGALALLIIGVILARLIGRLVRKALEAAGADDLAERWGVNRVLSRAGLPPSLSRLTGTALRIGLTVVVIIAALSLLGLQFLSVSLNAGVLLLPKLLTALILLLAGLVVAALVRDRVDRLTEQMDLPVALGRVAQAGLIAVFAITAAAQLTIATLPLLVLLGIATLALAGSFTLAFGLGGRDVARAVSAGRYARTAVQPGQRIRVAGISGEVEAVESAATLLRTEAGELVRLPNNMLLEHPVFVEERASGE